VIRHEEGDQLTLYLKTVEAYEEVFECSRDRFVRWSDTEPEPTTPPPGPSDGSAPSPSGLQIMDSLRLRECSTAYGLFVGKRYLIMGKIGGFDQLPDPIATILGVPFGEGARFNILSTSSEGATLPLTVFTRAPDHTRQLLLIFSTSNGSKTCAA
jgi:hypothetical protein